MERLGGRGRRRAAHNLRLPRAVASRLRSWRSRYHETLRPRNRADFARHGAVISGAGRALCRQSETVGLLGLVGFLMAFLGTCWWRAPSGKRPSSCRGWHGRPPSCWTKGPQGLALCFISSYTLAGLGVILFGVATIRARVFPMVAAVL